MPVNTYKIFLASSAELLQDRREFSDLINYLNNENIRLHRGAQFQQVKWEWVDESVADLRKQDDYNQLLDGCDLFVMLYWTKVGKYSEEEFDRAYPRLRDTRKLLVYKKTAPPPTQPSDADAASLTAFDQKLLRDLKHFVGHYETVGDLKHSIQTEITRLFNDGVLAYSEMSIATCLSAGQPAVPTGFIGRDEELRTIRRKMDDGGTLMLINSEGGMGKTSLAARYWADELYRYTHNAWLFCENGIVDEISKLAPALGLDLTKLPESQHVPALRTAMQNLPKDCLLVLDNANDEKQIEAFRQLFSGLHWHVLMTSRCQHVLPAGQELPITHLPPPLARELFVSLYAIEKDNSDFDVLLNRFLVGIGYNTLLIELFAKNMAELAALGETFADFLKRLETGGLFLEDYSFEVSTAYTTHIHKEAATTDDILNALYDLTNLEEPDRYWLVNLALLPAESHLLTLLLELFAPENKIAFSKQLKQLARKGWLTTDTFSYRMSPVVQTLVLKKNQPTLDEDGKQLVNRLTNLLALEQDKDNITTKFKWIAYTVPLLTQFNASSHPDFSVFQNNLALVLQDLGGETNLQQAQRLLEAALANNIANFGESSPHVAATQSNLATVFQALGGGTNLRQAQHLLQQALANNIANFGQASPDVATIQSNLAMVFQALGGETNLQQAQRLLQQALANNIANFGESALNVAIAQSNLAMVFQSLGGETNLQQAQHLLQQALANAIANFGESAPTVATRQSNLAMVLQSLGGETNLQQAQHLLQQAMANDIANFGESTPTVATRQSNLALVLQDLGGETNLQQAQHLLEAALANAVANFGKLAPTVATRQSNLATVLQALGGEANLQQAQHLLEAALANNIANFGESAPTVATRKSNLAYVLLNLGDRKMACELWSSAYGIFRNSIGETHPHAVNVLRFLQVYCPECFEQ